MTKETISKKISIIKKLSLDWIQLYETPTLTFNTQIITLWLQFNAYKTKANKGETLNTDVHEAIYIHQTQEKPLKGKVLFVRASGYKLNNQLIKCSNVIGGN
ncbi:nucleotide exchange factor GrpE [Candidatus Karelsulcia muelleri]